jgi:hypothetical protein
MKGAFLVSPAADLFDTVRRALLQDAAASGSEPGGDADARQDAEPGPGTTGTSSATDAAVASVAETTGTVQYTDARGRLFTVESDAGPEFDYRQGPFTAADPSQALPDMATVTAVDVECRWEDLFARLCARIATLSPDPIWVLDDDGVIWPAAAVDPDRVRL